MRHPKFDAWLRQASRLSVQELREATRRIDAVVRERESDIAIEEHADKRSACPHCSSARYIRWGRERGLQRWRCKDCGKTFNGLTGTTFARTHYRDLIIEIMRGMHQERLLSCRSEAKRLGVHHTSVWRWRRRVMQALEGFGDDALGGIVEADETFQRESRKGSREWVRHKNYPKLYPAPPRPRGRDYERRGLKLPRGLSRWQIPILVLRDRANNTVARRIHGLQVVHIGPLLDAFVPDDAVLCSDGAGVYRTYSQQRQLRLEPINARARQHVRGAWHVQNVNAFHERLKDLVRRRFRGPATKYWPGYVGWILWRDRTAGDPDAPARLYDLVASSP